MIKNAVALKALKDLRETWKHQDQSKSVDAAPIPLGFMVDAALDRIKFLEDIIMNEYGFIPDEED